MSTSKKKLEFQEFTHKRAATHVWENFLRAQDGRSAKCKHCNKTLKCIGGSTSGLHAHIKHVHPQIGKSANVESSEIPTSTASNTSEYSEPTQKKRKTQKISEYFSPKNQEQESMNEMISRMIALDGMPYRLFCESKDLRQLFKNSGHELPRSTTTISKIVQSEGQKVESLIKETVIALKASGDRLTISLDEWTSLRNKRFMNINLHSKAFGGNNFKNLGLVKITGSMPATSAIRILEEHLNHFDVSLQDDVVSITTDGASVMVKMGTFFNGIHQLCLAHGIQLAVIAVLYKQPKQPQNVVAANPNSSDETNASSDDSDDNPTCETEIISNQEDSFQIMRPAVCSDLALYKPLIQKVRLVIREVRHSPLKADILRKYVQQQHNHDIQLVLDCQTRWSSLADMVSSFLKVKDSLMKAMIDWKSSITFSETEISTLNKISESLGVIKSTVEALCRRDANLLTADTALRFMLKKLDAQNNYLASELATALRIRIKQRRIKYAAILQYLHDPEEYFKLTDTEVFVKADSDEIAAGVVGLIKRLKEKTSSPGTSSNPGTSANMSAAISVPTLSFQEELDLELKNKCSYGRSASQNLDLEGFVNVEKAMFDNGGVRGPYLTQAYNYLLTVLPTSVEPERVFSSAGYFCNRLRSSLSDESLSALSVLRTYYQEKRSFS